MKRSALRYWALPWLMAAGLAPTSGCSEDAAVVGGRCADGRTQCGSQCLDLQDDPAHCGGCSVRCEPGIACVSGRCGLGTTDAGSDAADADASTGFDGDSSQPDAPTDGDGAGGDVAMDGCTGSGCGDADAAGSETGGDAPDAIVQTDAPDDTSDVSVEDGDTCVPPYDNGSNCGACGVVCQGSTPVCKPDGDGGLACAPFCAPEFTQCGSECKDLQTDENNCGACDKHCITGICYQGQCVGGGVGHVVLAGMNFHAWYPGSPQTRLFSNSVFLPSHNPVRVLAWSQYGDKSAGGAVSKVTELLAWSSSQIGRPYTLTDCGAATDVPDLLVPGQQDVLLVLDQPNAPLGGLATIGAAWNPAVSDFVLAGGTVVVLMSTQGQNQMHEFVSGAGLGAVTALHDITVPFHILANVAPSDAIGINVLSPFLARAETATIQTTMTPSSDTVFVVVDSTQPDAGSELPVVIHRVVLP